MRRRLLSLWPAATISAPTVRRSTLPPLTRSRRAWALRRAALRADRAFREAVAVLGQRYLGGGCCLVHGSFHPGNWLSLPGGGVRVLDPQYGGWGDAEFDIGTGVAHLLLARQPDEIVKTFVAAAVGPDGDGDEPEDSGRPSSGVRMALIARYAGVETARRLVGGGQLPLAVAAGVRCALLDAARTAVVEGRLEVLEA